MSIRGRTNWAEYCHRQHEALLATILSRYGMTLATWKSLKAIVDLAALVLAYQAMMSGMEPITALIFAAVIIQGPEVLEYVAVKQVKEEQNATRDEKSKSS